MAEADDLVEPLPPTMEDETLKAPIEPSTDMPPEVIDLEEGEEEDVGEGPERRRSRLSLLLAAHKKKKKKKKPKKKVKPPPVKRPNKEEYEKTIADLNRVLVGLLRRVMALDEINAKHNTLFVETKEDHQNVAEHLKRVCVKHIETLTIEEHYNRDIIEKREVLAVESKATITSLQKDYNQIRSQLLGEIEMLTIKLSTLRVFSDAREDILRKIGEMEIEYKQIDRRYKDRLYEMQQKVVVQRNNLHKEANARFNRIIDDFNDWRQVRNADYKHRLLMENKELRSKYNKLVPLNFKKERELNAILEMTANARDTHAAVFDVTKLLERTQVKRNALIEKLEKLKRFYKLQVILGSKYRRLFEAIKRYEMKEDNKLGDETWLCEDLQEQSAILMEKLQAVKQAEYDYLNAKQQFDDIVNGVRYAIFSLCQLPEYEHLYPQSFAEYDANRNVILKGLVELMTSSERKLTTKPLLRAQYYKGFLGFIPLDTVICQLFKSFDSSETLNLYKEVPSFCLPLSDFSGAGGDGLVQEKKDESSDLALLCLK